MGKDKLIGYKEVRKHQPVPTMISMSEIKQEIDILRQEHYIKKQALKRAGVPKKIWETEADFMMELQGLRDRLTQINYVIYRSRKKT